MASRFSRRTALLTTLAAAGSVTAFGLTRGFSLAEEPAPRRPRPPEVGDVAYVDVAVATMWVDPATAREVDAPAVSNPVDSRAWMETMSLAERRWLVGKLETQAHLGQEVTILETSGDWLKVAVHGQPTPREELGYPGWVPAVQLADTAPAGNGAIAIVRTASTWLHDEAELSTQFMELSYGNRLNVLEESESAVKVATPSAGDKWLDAGDVAVYSSPTEIPVPEPQDLVADADMFVGLPYLWAGVSAFGFDCSGFTHQLYKTHGITIPRDADAQLADGAGVPDEELSAGDLLFYGTDRIHHVGMHIGDGHMIDARTNSETEEQLIEIVAVEDHPYAHEYAGAVRYL